jgi:hypothetical protein
VPLLIFVVKILFILTRIIICEQCRGSCVPPECVACLGRDGLRGVSRASARSQSTNTAQDEAELVPPECVEHQSQIIMRLSIVGDLGDWRVDLTAKAARSMLYSRLTHVVSLRAGFVNAGVFNHGVIDGSNV